MRGASDFAQLQIRHLLRGFKSLQGFDHIALAARGMTEMADRLKACGVAFETREVPGRPRKQIFFVDPDGVKVELQFDARIEAGG